MTLSLILLMGYMLTGDLAHEIIGTVMIALWVIHTGLNRRWYPSVIRSSYPPKRVIGTIINLLLVVTMAGLIISSVMLSTYIFGFLRIERGMAFARTLHMITSYWSLVLISLHIGMHWSRLAKIIRNHTHAQSSPIRSAIGHILAVMVSIYGLYAFISQRIASYLFLRTQFVFFDFEQSPLSFFSEYIAMIILFAAITYYLSTILTKVSIPGRRQPCCTEED